jgi:8-oxo-dGTP pyrophosphatase MutT (NUDIX family)
MNNPVIIGVHNPSIEYKDRLTVKALIFNNKNKVLIINNGLLPGGGVEDYDEDNITALRRETIEELGIAISDIKEIGQVVQYRDHIHKKYIIHGYKVRFVDNLSNTNPQNQGEADFIHDWYTVDDAINLTNNSINQMLDINAGLDDNNQGKLFNLMTTLELLNLYTKSSKLVH